MNDSAMQGDLANARKGGFYSWCCGQHMIEILDGEEAKYVRDVAQGRETTWGPTIRGVFATAEEGAVLGQHRA